MGVEQRISASAFTHRGEDNAANTGNFLLDGRQPFDFELDNSHVSIIGQDKHFFFAVCDTKVTDDLNASVSGIKELKKLHTQIKTGSRDIKSNTEILGECFVGTEDLLYDTAGYADRGGARQSPGKPLASLDKKLTTYSGKDMDGDRDDGDGEADDDDGYTGGRGRRAGDEIDDDFDEADDRDYDDDDDYDDVDPQEDETDSEPGKKGFSTTGFILSEKKGSILAQGDCEAFMFRGGSLRVLSGGGKKVSVTLNRSQPQQGQTGQYGNRAPLTKTYAGRSSEIFEPREGDVYMLCTTSVVLAIGEENIDSYLSMGDELAFVNSTIMYDAVKNDPASNMTCMLIKVDEIRDEEAPAAAAVQPRRGAEPGRADGYGYATASGPAVTAGADQTTGGAMAGGPRYNQGGRPAPALPQYREQETRISQTPYQNRDAFSKRATSRFDTPPRKISFANNKSLITSIITTVALIAILIMSYYFFVRNNDDNPSQSANATRTTTPNAANTTPTTSDDDENGGNNGSGGHDSTTSTTERRTTTTTEPTTTTTTEPPEQVYTIKSGDTLTRIAQRFYGNANGKLYTLIKERNGLTSDNIFIGDTLIIPPKPESADGSGQSDSGSQSSDSQGSGGTTAGRQSSTTSR